MLVNSFNSFVALTNQSDKWCWNGFCHNSETAINNALKSAAEKNEDRNIIFQNLKKVKFSKNVKLCDGQRVNFCEKCNKLYKANQYCDFCSQIYFSTDDDADMDGKMWIKCDMCEKWNHNDCEINANKD